MVAKLRQAQIQTEVLQNMAPLSSRGRQKLSDFAERYLATASYLRPTTLRRYRGLVKLNIDAILTYPDPLEPQRTRTICLGQVPLKKIDTEMVKEWNYAVKTTRGPTEAAKSYRCLSGIMTEAFRMGQIYAHPCKVKKASEEPSPPRRLPDDDVPGLLFEAFMNYRNRLGNSSRQRLAAIPVFVGYGTGMRKSEVRGLRRRDVDLDEGRIRVECQAFYDPTNGWNTEAPLKTKSGRRTIWIEGPALEALAWHMATFMRPASADPEGEDLIFTGERGMGPISDTGWQRAWTRAKADAGVNPKLNLHDLRHRAATTVAQDQKEVKVIQEFLGDSTVAATMRYLHATDESKKALAGSLAKSASKHFSMPGTEQPDNVVPIRRGSHA